MSTTIAGSIRSVSIDSKTYAVDGEADPSISPGFSVDLKGNGDGSTRKIITTKPWSITGLKVAIPNAAAHDHLKKVARSPDLVAIVLEKSDGTYEQGVGTITGEVKYNPKDGTAEIDLGGEKELVTL